LLSEEDSPPTEPDTFKINKMPPAEHYEVGWESPLAWEFGNGTLAARIAKIKKRDGEVENLVYSPPNTPSL
jgi:hypothetical protein